MGQKLVLSALMRAPWISSTAQVQPWPVKPVRFITAFGAGGSSDVMARIVAGELTNTLGKQFIVDNRSGGNGVLCETTR